MSRWFWSCWVYKGTSTVKSILSDCYFPQFKLKHAGDISGASKDALSREDSWQACQKLLHLPQQAEQPKFSSAYTPEIECKRPKNGQWGRRQATGSSLFHLWSCFYIIFTGLVLNMYLLILSCTNLKVEQHLAGKNHTRLAAGLPGLKAGYFNKTTGKWERAPPEEHQETPTPAPTPSLPSTSLGSKVANEHNFYCQLCKVTCCQVWFCLLKLCNISQGWGTISNPDGHAPQWEEPQGSAAQGQSHVKYKYF